MNKINIPAEAARKLDYIQSKYDIFFRANNKHFWDYFELNNDSYATLRIKAENNLPFTLLNELRKDFLVIER